MTELDRRRVKAAQANARPFRSGFCGLGNPETSHEHCRGNNGKGRPCVCDCHKAQELEPLEVVGVHDGVDEEAYHRHPSLSQSGAKLLVPPSTPAAFRWRMDHPPTSTKAFDVGHAAHTLVLGIGAPIVRIEADDWRTKAAKDQRDEAHAAGRTPLLAAQHDAVLRMAEAIRQHPIAGRLFDPSRGGRAEVTFRWDDDETGVPRRARADWLHMPASGRVIVADLKTSVNASPAAFGKKAADFGYHMQAPWYLDALAATGVSDDAAFVFVNVEKDPPHLISVVELDAEAVAIGRALNRQALATFADCTRTGDWPGYPVTVELASLPPWYARAHETDLYALQEPA